MSYKNWFASGKKIHYQKGMLEVVTQNRKKIAVLYLLLHRYLPVWQKGLREQCTLIYELLHLLVVLHRVRIKKPVLDSDGNVIEKETPWKLFLCSF